MNNNNTTIMNYGSWNPADGDFKKVNASADNRIIQKRLKKDKIFKIFLISLWIIIAASSFYFLVN